jgi:hypothetical protein
MDGRSEQVVMRVEMIGSNVSSGPWTRGPSAISGMSESPRFSTTYVCSKP